jgi:hypothetical protein
LGTASYADFAGNASSVDKLITSSSNAIYTASVSSNVITFTKGNGTFSLTVDTGSGGGPSSPDSPDRINGTATAEVIANLDNNGITFSTASFFKILGEDTTGNNLIDAIGTTSARQVLIGDAIMGEINVGSGNVNIKSNAPINHYNNSLPVDTYIQSSAYVVDLDLTTTDYYATWVGVHTVSQCDDPVTFFLPDATIFKGLSIQIINKDTVKEFIIAPIAGTLYGPTVLTAERMAIFYSDGLEWHGFSTNRN